MRRSGGHGEREGEEGEGELNGWLLGSKSISLITVDVVQASCLRQRDAYATDPTDRSSGRWCVGILPALVRGLGDFPETKYPIRAREAVAMRARCPHYGLFPEWKSPYTTDRSTAGGGQASCLRWQGADTTGLQVNDLDRLTACWLAGKPSLLMLSNRAL